jgi:hypothetical protein
MITTMMMVILDDFVYTTIDKNNNDKMDICLHSLYFFYMDKIKNKTKKDKDKKKKREKKRKTHKPPPNK